MIRERVAGVDPREFWARPLARDRLLGMRDKYEAALALARMPADAQRTAAIRELARRWPGSLREAELIGPTRVAERLAEATHASELEPHAPTGEAWRARGDSACAVLLWSHLHRAIAEVLLARRGAGGPSTLAWPGLDALPELRERKLEVRVAYLWLAACAGLSLPTLGRVLFARSGHWDRRPGDPAWAHEPDPG